MEEKKYELTGEQSEILNTEGNIAVWAGPGSGKTFILLKKVEKDLGENKTHKTVAVMTFTKKATNELINRVERNNKEIFLGTINSFVLNEIIKPFINDIDGFQDIDANKIVEKFNRKKNTYKELLETMKKDNVICGYKGKKNNFLLQISLKIIKESEACRKYLKARYFKIYIDEYQDCDNDMHELFKYLYKELGIYLMVIGDNRQSIYSFRGAIPKNFKELINSEDFNAIELRINFRCNREIQNFCNLLFEERFKYYKETEKKENVKFINKINNENCKKNIEFKLIFEYIDEELDFTVLRSENKNLDAKLINNLAREKGLTNFNCRIKKNTLVEDIQSKYKDIYVLMAKYLLLRNVSIEDFKEYLPQDIGEIVIKKISLNLNELKNKYLKLEKICLEAIENNESLLKILEETVLLISDENEEEIKDNIDAIIKTIADEKSKNMIGDEIAKHSTMTIHSSKGLEFDQVVINLCDFKIFDGRSKEKREEELNKLYVAASRAKEKLFIIGTESEYALLEQLISKSEKKLEDLGEIIFL